MLTGNLYKNGTVALLAKRYLYSLGLFSIARLVFYIVNFTYFANVGPLSIIFLFITGLYFDLSAVALINAPFFLAIAIPQPYRHTRFMTVTLQLLYFVPNIIALILNLGDAVYYPFTLKRLTTDIFTYLQTDQTSVAMMPKFLFYYWPVTLAGIACIFLFVRLVSKTSPINFGKAIPYTLKNIVLDFSFLLVGAFFTVIAFRGGFFLKPINIINAGQFVPAEHAPFVLNTPFTLIKTIGKKGLAYKTDFPNEELNSIYSPVHQFLSDSAGFKQLNVVYIILESFSKEHLGLGNEKFAGGTYSGFTPFLDSLLQQGLYFPNAFSNGKRSIEGIPPLLSGIPTYMDDAYITSPYAGNKVNSIASLLKPLGYHSSFYHGGFNGTMGFSSFTDMAKFDAYLGKSEYPNQNDFDGNWGISDEPYLQYFAEQLNGKKQPFVSVVFTLSSHQPYIVPKHFSGTLRKGKLPIQQCVMYTDQALRKFFYNAARMPWFNNTLFVISADHCSEADLPYYQTRAGNYRIPILLYRPNSDLHGVDERIIQQTDILPSVLDYLGYEGSCVAFGSSVFKKDAPRFAVSYLNGSYQLIKDGYILHYDGNKATALYQSPADSLMKQNIIAKDPEMVKNLEHFLKGFIQQYNNRLIDNRLTIDKDVSKENGIK